MAPVLQLNKAAAATHSPWVKWQDSAVMAAHQLYPISNLNPFQGDLLIDAECGRDMTALNPDISQPQPAPKQVTYSNMENEGQYKLHIYSQEQ